MIILWKCLEPGRTWNPLRRQKPHQMSGFDVSTAKLCTWMANFFQPSYTVNWNTWMAMAGWISTTLKIKLGTHNDTHPEVAAKEMLLNCWNMLKWDTSKFRRTMQHEGARWFEIFDVRGLRPWSSGDSGCPLANFWTSTVWVPSYRTSAAQPASAGYHSYHLWSRYFWVKRLQVQAPANMSNCCLRFSLPAGREGCIFGLRLWGFAE